MPEPVFATDVILSSKSNSRPQTVVQWTHQRRRFFQRKNIVEKPIGIALLVLFMPVIVVLWLLVKLTSSGPGFYRQTRLGLNKQEFQLFKLRSMSNDAEANGQAIWANGADNRVTRLGKVLRKFHLDELPQLVNVVRGEMALVGPRPERPCICSSLQQKIEGYYDRVLVKPGISGLSQINLESDLTLEDVVRKQTLDLHYINETSFWFEFRIIIATALRFVGIKGETTMKLMRLCRRSLVEELEAKTSEQPSLNWEVSTQLSLLASTDSATNAMSNVIESSDPPHSISTVVFPHVAIPETASSEGVPS